LTNCNTLQHTATHRNPLQHTATHCNAQPGNKGYSYFWLDLIEPDDMGKEGVLPLSMTHPYP